MYIMLTVGSAAAVVSGAAFALLASWAKRRYEIIRQDYPIDIDEYVHQKPNLKEKIQCALLRRFIRKSRDLNNDKPYKIAVDEATDLQGLQVTRRAMEGEKPASQKVQRWKKAPIIIGSIRKSYLLLSSFGVFVSTVYSTGIFLCPPIPVSQLLFLK